MKSFERLVLAYLKDITGPLLDTLQFAYRAKQVCGWCSQHGTALLPAAPRQTWELRKDPICGLQFGLQYHHAWPSLRQTHTAFCAHLHLSVDHQLPNSHPGLSWSALAPLRFVFSPHYSSPSTWMTTLQRTILSSSWSCRRQTIYSHQLHEGQRRVCLQTGG